MSDTIARGSAFDDAPDPAPWQAMTAAQAQELREKDPSISPWRVVAAQAAAGLVCVAVVWAATQRTSAAWSALYGAAATVIPCALLARGMTRGRTLKAAGPVASAAGFMFWEMLKVGVAITMLVIAARVVADLSWPALLVTMVVCIKVNWVALLWRPGRLKNKANRHGS